MNIKRFHAATSREALAKARMAFGEGTLILSNRPTANGVEGVATAEDALGSIDQPPLRWCGTTPCVRFSPCQKRRCAIRFGVSTQRPPSQHQPWTHKA